MKRILTVVLILAALGSKAQFGEYAKFLSFDINTSMVLSQLTFVSPGFKAGMGLQVNDKNMWFTHLGYNYAFSLADNGGRKANINALSLMVDYKRTIQEVNLNTSRFKLYLDLGVGYGLNLTHGTLNDVETYNGAKHSAIYKFGGSFNIPINSMYRFRYKILKKSEFLVYVYEIGYSNTNFSSFKNEASSDINIITSAPTLGINWIYNL